GAMAIFARCQASLLSRLRETPGQVPQHVGLVQLRQSHAVTTRGEAARRRDSVFVDEQELLSGPAVRHRNSFILAAGSDPVKISVASVEENPEAGEPGAKARDLVLPPRCIL